MEDKMRIRNQNYIYETVLKNFQEDLSMRMKILDWDELPAVKLAEREERKQIYTDLKTEVAESAKRENAVIVPGKQPVTREMLVAKIKGIDKEEKDFIFRNEMQIKLIPIFKAFTEGMDAVEKEMAEYGQSLYSVIQGGKIN